MPKRGFEKISRDEILAALRRYTEGRGEQVTMQEFCGHLGISPSTLLVRWGRWRELRRAAGLMRPRAAPPVEFSDSFLIAEYRRICKELGRPPKEAEFNQRARCRMITLYKRFGTLAAIRRRAQIADDFAACFGRDLPTGGKPRMAWDEAWLGELWKRVRVGFVLHSSDLMGRGPLSYDVVFCARHDWPVCPVPVLVAAEVLGERATATGVAEPAGELRVES
jgi:transposase-like protein